MHEHGTKTTPVFLHADGEASCLLLPNLVSLLSGGTVQPENTYSRILKVTGQVWESQKRISITLVTASTSVHLAKPVSTDLTIRPDSVVTNPIGKDGVRSWSMYNIYPILSISKFSLGGLDSSCLVSAPKNSLENSGFFDIVVFVPGQCFIKFHHLLSLALFVGPMQSTNV